MPSPRYLTLVLALVAAVVAAGCGSSDDDPAARKAKEARQAEQERKEEADRLVVVPGTGIAGVRVGDDEDAVFEELGEPDERSKVPNEFSGMQDDRYEWKQPAIAVVLVQQPAMDGQPARSEVILVETTDRQVRTANGTGVGDLQQDVESAYPEVDCDAGQLRICRLGRQQAGDVVTDFFIEEGAVTRVAVGRIID